MLVSSVFQTGVGAIGSENEKYTIIYSTHCKVDKTVTLIISN